jgi:hypothetical protein
MPCQMAASADFHSATARLAEQESGADVAQPARRADAATPQQSGIP